MNNLLLQQVQRLGELRSRRQALDAQEQQLVLAVRGQMAEHGLKIIRSGGYESMLIEQERLTIRPQAFQKAVGKKEFLRCVTVNVTAAKELLGVEKLRRMSDITTSVQLRIAACEERAQKTFESADVTKAENATKSVTAAKSAAVPKDATNPAAPQHAFTRPADTQHTKA